MGTAVAEQTTPVTPVDALYAEVYAERFGTPPVSELNTRRDDAEAHRQALAFAREDRAKASSRCVALEKDVRKTRRERRRTLP